MAVPGDLPFTIPSSIATAIRGPFFSLESGVSYGILSKMALRTLAAGPTLWTFTHTAVTTSSSASYRPWVGRAPPSLTDTVTEQSPRASYVVTRIVKVFVRVTNSSPFLGFADKILERAFTKVRSLSRWPKADGCSLGMYSASLGGWTVVASPSRVLCVVSGVVCSLLLGIGLTGVAGVLLVLDLRGYGGADFCFWITGIEDYIGGYLVFSVCCNVVCQLP